MDISVECIKLVQKWEGFYEEAYDDLQPKVKLTKNTKLKGVLTIGFGTTKYADGSKVKVGDKITRKEAEELLRKQVNEHASTIKTYVKVPLSQNQYDALASFQYNLGRHILKDTALLRYLNAKQFDKAAAEMMKYNKARVNGQLTVLAGLTNRRSAEVALFNKKETIKVVEDNDVKFANSDLKGVYDTRKVSKATEDLLVTAAKKYLNINKKQLLEGDKAAIAYELAVHFAKLNK